MSWLENIRNKPHHEKIRLIWIFAIITGVLLILLWIATTRINKNLPKDTSLFNTISRGVSDLRNNYKK